MIAAVAIRHGYRLVTRNTKDFELTGVRLFNPWDPLRAHFRGGYTATVLREGG